MSKKLIDAIVEYIDKKIDYELSCMEIREDGYYSSHVTEWNAKEKALQDIYIIREKLADT